MDVVVLRLREMGLNWVWLGEVVGMLAGSSERMVVALLTLREMGLGRG